MPRLNEDQRNNTIGRLQAGETKTHVSRVLNVSQSNISRLWDRYQQQGSIHDCLRSERPRVTTPAQDRHIRLRHLRDRFTTATSTAAAIPGQRRISDQTVRNRLREAGIRARRPVKAVVLTRRHVKSDFNGFGHIEYGYSNTREQFGSATNHSSC